MIDEGVITEFDDEFYGVLIDERGVKISIPGALIGERVRYHVEHSSPHVQRAWGRCDALLQPSPQRQKAPCPLSWPTAGMCPGCPLMHMSGELQAQLKRQYVLNCLHRAGLTYLRDIALNDAPIPLHYRNRSDFVAAEIRGKFILGSYKPRSHEALEIRRCPILRAPLSQVLSFITHTARKMNLRAARPSPSLTGTLRYVSLFANDRGHVLVDLVCQSAAGQKPAWIDDFAHALRGFFPIKGVSWSVNDSPHNAIRVEPSRRLWGLERIDEHYGDIAIPLSASGFTQLNSDVAAAIYQTARQWAGTQPDIAWDLYCGVGGFGRTMRPKRALYGAEFSPSAIQAAIQAASNAPFDTHFEVLDLEHQWPDTWPNPDVVLLDPPRKGLSQNVIQHLLTLRPPKILYMSCNPESFAQNAAQLAPHYVIDTLQAFDMMPQTRQVELLAMLYAR